MHFSLQIRGYFGKNLELTFANIHTVVLSTYAMDDVSCNTAVRIVGNEHILTDDTDLWHMTYQW